MKKSYVYTDSLNFCYENLCIAKPNDVVVIDDTNIKVGNKTIDCTKIPENVVENLIKKCVEIDSENGIDDGFTEYSKIDDILNDEVASKVLTNINKKALKKLFNLGIIRTTTDETCQDYHIGNSNYSKHIIQPWHIWQDYNLNPWDADIIKRILRTKKEGYMTENEARIMDYKKIIHICNERIRQLDIE